MPDNREKIFKWQCLFPRCTSKRGRAYRLSNEMSASRHAASRPGHNVAVMYWTPEGDVFLKVIQHTVAVPTESYEQAPF